MCKSVKHTCRLNFTSSYMYTCSHLNGVLAHSKCVPEFDGVISGSRHNLSVVCREGYAHNILRMAHKPPCGGTTGGGKNK